MFDVILDRDGIANVDVGYTFRVTDFRFPDGTIQAFQLLRDAGARFSIATGQSGIARGKYTVANMEAFNEHLLEQLRQHGISVEAVVYCPHHPEHSGDCDCRKPKTGMLKQIAERLGSIDWSKSWGIGDKASDSQMMLTMGGRAVLVRSGSHNNTTGEVYWTERDKDVQDLLKNRRSFIADNNLHAAQMILEHM